MKKAIVIGASSGIGKDLVKILALNGYEVGMLSRRIELLEQLQNEIPTRTYVDQLDISHHQDALDKVYQMIKQMGGTDLIVINSGIGFINPDLDWNKEKQTIDVNVSGFCALAGQAYNYFAKQGHGQIVGISSIAALSGNEAAPAYNASKAFISNYMMGLRKKAYKEGRDIVVTDIRPGYVDTEMTKGLKMFWVATSEKAAKQIFEAIRKKKRLAYITHRWRLISWLVKCMPEWAYMRF